MGGGLSRHELAVAVSEAGGLGTIAVNGAEAIRRELAAARALTGRPLAVNLLLPFARRSWFEAAAAADVVVTFWGRPRRRTPGVWLHQCGSVEEAREAQAAGADAVILQGVEAGGHVRGTVPALQLLEQGRAALPADYPLLLAGGVAEPSDVCTALEAGASAAVAGTRFLLTEESRAHAAYRQRLVEAGETILTDLFGAAWPAPHRVVRNPATERWLGGVRPFPTDAWGGGGGGGPPPPPGGGVPPPPPTGSGAAGESSPQPAPRSGGALHAGVAAAAADAAAASRQPPAHPGGAG